MSTDFDHTSSSRDRDKEYVITMPSMYARGILFGKMVLELGDSCTVRNEQTGMRCDVDFKTKVCIRYYLCLRAWLSTLMVLASCCRVFSLGRITMLLGG